MPVVRHVFQMFNVSRKLDVTHGLPDTGSVSINVTINNPPKIVNFEGKDTALITSTVNIRIEENIAEAMMRGETLYEFKDETDKQKCLKNIDENKRLPRETEEEIMNDVAARAVLSLVKAHVEIGIPPPVPLPRMKPPP